MAILSAAQIKTLTGADPAAVPPRLGVGSPPPPPAPNVPVVDGNGRMTPQWYEYTSRLYQWQVRLNTVLTT